MLLKMWLDPRAPPQLAGLHIPPIGSQLVHSLSIVYPLKLIRAGCGSRFRGMRSLTFAACGNKTLFSIIFTTSPLAKSWIRACLLWSPHHYGHSFPVPNCIPQRNLTPCNTVTSLLPSPVGDRIREVPLYLLV